MTMRISEARWPETVQRSNRCSANMCHRFPKTSASKTSKASRRSPGKYARPGGVVLIAWDGDSPAGAVAYRMFDAGVCEMKRLYVRPSVRGRGLARDLANELIEDARARGFRTMLLDTLASSSGACALSRSRLRAGRGVLRQSTAGRDVHGVELAE